MVIVICTDKGDRLHVPTHKLSTLTCPKIVWHLELVVNVLNLNHKEFFNEKVFKYLAD